MAVYNGERWLGQTLTSLADQTFDDFEVIVIDDGSTDKSASILAEAAARDARYRVITQANCGLVASLNRGLAEARAPLVARIDADDIAEPERFARQLNFLAAHPKVAALGSAIRIIDADGAFLRLQAFPCGPKYVYKAMIQSCALAHPAVMMRRDMVLAVGGYREAFRHAEDYDLWLRLGEIYELDNLPEPLLRYRHHGQSVSFRYRQQQSLATHVARHCAQARRSGRPDDQFSGLKRPIDQSILETLDLAPADEACYRFELLRVAVWPAGLGNDGSLLDENMERAWALRAYLPAGRFVRHCIIPYARHSRKQGRPEHASRWLRRALGFAPLSTLWGLLTAIVRNSKV